MKGFRQTTNIYILYEKKLKVQVELGKCDFIYDKRFLSDAVVLSHRFQNKCQLQPGGREIDRENIN